MSFKVTSPQSRSPSPVISPSTPISSYREQLQAEQATLMENIEKKHVYDVLGIDASLTTDRPRLCAIENTLDFLSWVDDLSHPSAERIANLLLQGHTWTTYLSMIGQGSFGDVFRCTSPVLGDIVRKNPLSNTSLTKEMELQMRCAHENVISVLGKTDQSFLMENAGKNLNTIYREIDEARIRLSKIANIESFTEEKEALEKQINDYFASLLNIFTQIARGMAHIHERGVVHHDIKPQNIMMRNGVVRIGDFGQAISSDELEALCQNVLVETPSCSNTQVFLRPVSRLRQALRPVPTEEKKQRPPLLGTAPFWAPEVVRQQRQGTASDVFSFGMTLYSLVAGRYPYENYSNFTSQQWIVPCGMLSFCFKDALGISAPFPANPTSDEERELIRRFRAVDPTGALQTLVTRCLAINPQDRPTMSDVVEILQAIPEAKASDISEE